jgi:protein TonB
LLPNDIKTEIIKEEKKEEPPPPPPPPPDQATPPPPFVPPVEVAIATPMEAPPTAITTTSEKPPVTAPPIMAPKQVVVKAHVDFKKSLGTCDDLYNQSSALKRDGAQGSVVVRCTIGTNGKCADAAITESSGIDGLDQLAVKCSRELLRFTPGTVDGAAQATVLDFRLKFKPQNER